MKSEVKNKMVKNQCFKNIYNGWKINFYVKNVMRTDDVNVRCQSVSQSFIPQMLKSQQGPVSQ